jgi:hypothetical protein
VPAAAGGVVFNVFFSALRTLLFNFFSRFSAANISFERLALALLSAISFSVRLFGEQKKI